MYLQYAQYTHYDYTMNTVLSLFINQSVFRIQCGFPNDS